jgi:hypothetical protein
MQLHPGHRRRERLAAVAGVVNPIALEQAREYLGLQLPVCILWKPLEYGDTVTYGTYVGIRKEAHLIHLNNNRRISRSRLNATVWHELTHAKQCERVGGNTPFTRLYRQQLWDAGVFDVPDEDWEIWLPRKHAISLEREADDMAELCRAGHLHPKNLLLSYPAAMVKGWLGQIRSLTTSGSH